MAHKKQAGLVRAKAKEGLTYSGEPLNMTASMTNSKTADLKVLVCSGCFQDQ